MKKLLSVLLALMIMLSCVCAFAENSTVQSNLTEFDFGDFTMTLDEDILGEVYEKANNEIYFEIYPLFDENAEFHSTINCVWSAETEDFTQVDATEYANVILDGILNAMVWMPQMERFCWRCPTGWTANIRSAILYGTNLMELPCT